jgi:hypothetical protein
VHERVYFNARLAGASHPCFILIRGNTDFSLGKLSAKQLRDSGKV